MANGRSSMDDNPFSHTTSALDSPDSRRRSTRIDFITTVLLSGKDAGGTPFREFTQTSIVNLHGCKVRTSYQTVVGMLLTLDCPKAGMSAKGVCVRVWDSPTGVVGHEIAVQLVKPQNLWGVSSPPPDWEIVAKAMVRQGRGIQAQPPAQPAVPAPPRAPVSISVPRAPAIPKADVFVAPVPPPVVALLGPTPDAGLTFEQRLAELERRSTQLMESVLDIMRGQAEELTRRCLVEFGQQVDALVKDADVRLRRGLQQAYEESAASLIGLRTDLMGQMASRGAQIIRSTEDTLRTRLQSQLAGEDKAVSTKPPAPVRTK